MRRHNSYCTPDNSTKMTACLQPTIVTRLAHSCQQQMSYAMIYSHMTRGISQDSKISPARVGCIWHGDNYVGGLLLKGIIKQLAFHMHMVILPVELSGIIVAVHVLKPADSTAPQSHIYASNAMLLMSVAIAIAKHLIECTCFIAICTPSLSFTLNPLRPSQQAYQDIAIRLHQQMESVASHKCCHSMSLIQTGHQQAKSTLCCKTFTDPHSNA